MVRASRENGGTVAITREFREWKVTACRLRGRPK
jgi:hypothetical protein